MLPPATPANTMGRLAFLILTVNPFFSSNCCQTWVTAMFSGNGNKPIVICLLFAWHMLVISSIETKRNNAKKRAGFIHAPCSPSLLGQGIALLVMAVSSWVAGSATEGIDILPISPAECFFASRWKDSDPVVQNSVFMYSNKILAQDCTVYYVFCGAID